MNEVRIPVTKCPRCGAICVTGSDEDFLVLCAHCRVSFKIEGESSISVDEYQKRRHNSKEYFYFSGWEAFYKP